jgi:hypothetical protein
MFARASSAGDEGERRVPDPLLPAHYHYPAPPALLHLPERSAERRKRCRALQQHWRACGRDVLSDSHGRIFHPPSAGIIGRSPHIALEGLRPRASARGRDRDRTGADSCAARRGAVSTWDIAPPLQPNRRASDDSRFWSPVPRAWIIGDIRTRLPRRAATRLGLRSGPRTRAKVVAMLLGRRDGGGLLMTPGGLLDEAAATAGRSAVPVGGGCLTVWGAREAGA